MPKLIPTIIKFERNKTWSVLGNLWSMRKSKINNKMGMDRKWVAWKAQEQLQTKTKMNKLGERRNLRMSWITF